jgi:hypothetical protein
MEPVDIRGITGFDVVSFPSAGGQFLPVLEAWSKEEVPMKGLVRRLLAYLTQEKQTSIFESVDRPPDTVVNVATLVKDHGEFVTALFEAIDIEVEDGNECLVLEALAKAADSAKAGTPDDHWAKGKGLKDDDKRKDMQSKSKKGRTRDDIIKGKGGGDDEGKKKGKGVTEDEDDEDEVIGLDRLDPRLKSMFVAHSKRAIDGIIAEAKLPKKLASFARKHWLGILEAQGSIDGDEVEAFVTDLKKGVGGSQDLGGGLTEDHSPALGAGTWTSGDKAIAAFDAMLAEEDEAVLEVGQEKIRIPAFHSLRQAYGVITGDVYCEGREFYMRERSARPRGIAESLDWDAIETFRQYRAVREGAGISEATMTTATFPLLLSDRMHKQMLKEYRQLALLWRLVARATTVTDFKTWRYLKHGEFANLQVVNEDALYADNLGAPSEEEVTLAIEKKGGISLITWETIVNDDLDRVRRHPGKIARAAWRTLNTEVFTHLAGNGAIYDTNNLASAAHNNYGTTIFGFDQLKAMRKEIHLQEDLDNKEPFRAVARNVLCGPDLYDEVYEAMFTDGIPTMAGTFDSPGATTGIKNTTQDNPAKPNVLRSKYGLGLHEIHDFGTGATASADDYWMCASPDEIDMILVGFLNGKQDPEMYVQDLERVGSFFDRDRITQKVRHVYKSVVVDYRGFAARIV